MHVRLEGIMTGIRRYITRLRHSFLTKVILILFFVSSLGVYVGTNLATLQTMDRLLQLEESYSQSVLRDDARSIGGLVDRILSVFELAYTPDFFGNSLETLLTNPSYASLSRTESSQRIQAKLEILGHNHPIIDDVALIDSVNRRFFFYSKQPGRGEDLGFELESSKIWRDLARLSNPITVIPPHVPDYVVSLISGDAYPVFSVALQIYDMRGSPMTNSVGTLILNLNPNVFSGIIQTTRTLGSGYRVLVAIEDTNKLVYDSAVPQYTELGEFVRSDWDEKDYFISELAVDGGYFRLIGLAEKSSILQNYRGARAVMAQVSVVTVFVLLIVALILSNVVSRRLQPLSTMMDHVKHGDLEFRIAASQADEVGEIEAAFNDMCQRLDDHIKTVYLGKLRYRTAQLRVLQQQMNPHFMYNALQSIQMSAFEHGDSTTAEMIRLLAEVFRWALDDSTAEVELNEELHYLEVFTKLHSLRFEESIYLEIDVPRKLRRCTVAKLILQPLLENAIHHGFRDQDRGRVRVSAKIDEDDIVLTVDDNGAGMAESDIENLLEALQSEEIKTPADGHQQIGLRNIHSRLRMFYAESPNEPSRYGISSVRNLATGGLSVSLRIPSRTLQDTLGTM